MLYAVEAANTVKAYSFKTSRMWFNLSRGKCTACRLVPRIEFDGPRLRPQRFKYTVHIDVVSEDYSTKMTYRKDYIVQYTLVATFLTDKKISLQMNLVLYTMYTVFGLELGIDLACLIGWIPGIKVLIGGTNMHMCSL